MTRQLKYIKKRNLTSQKERVNDSNLVQFITLLATKTTYKHITQRFSHHDCVWDYSLDEKYAPGPAEQHVHAENQTQLL